MYACGQRFMLARNKLDELKDATSCKDVWKVIQQGFYVETPCHSMARPGKIMAGVCVCVCVHAQASHTAVAWGDGNMAWIGLGITMSPCTGPAMAMLQNWLRTPDIAWLWRGRHSHHDVAEGAGWVRLHHSDAGHSAAMGGDGPGDVARLEAPHARGQTQRCLCESLHNR